MCTMPNTHVLMYSPKHHECTCLEGKQQRLVELVDLLQLCQWKENGLECTSGSLCPDPSLMMSYDWNAVFPKTVIKVRQEERKEKHTINTILLNYLR